MVESGAEARLAGSLFMDVWAQSLRKVISRLAALTPVPTLSLWLIRLFKRTNQEPGEDVNYPTVMQIEYSHGPAALVNTHVPRRTDTRTHNGWHSSGFAHPYTNLHIKTELSRRENIFNSFPTVPASAAVWCQPDSPFRSDIIRQRRQRCADFNNICNDPNTRRRVRSESQRNRQALFYNRLQTWIIHSQSHSLYNNCKIYLSGLLDAIKTGDYGSLRMPRSFSILASNV